VAIDGLTMLGDGRELPVLERLAAAEPARTAAECRELEFEGCEEPEALARKRAGVIARHGRRLEAAKACGGDAGCWVKRLADEDKGVVERAAMEVGRSRSAAHLGALLERLPEPHLNTRLALIHAVEWLLEDSREATAQARSVLPSLEKQLEAEKGRTEFIKVNEDLRRLVARLRRLST
jgi:hypothetical protein